jgi:TRAP transporter TAXI family solute receptor
MKSRFSRAVLVAALVAGLVPAGAFAAGRTSFSIVTGGTGGVWYPLGGAVGGVITKNVPNTDASSEATTAAIDNLKLLAAGRAGMAFCYDYHAVWANEGKIAAIAKQAKQPVRVVLSFYEQPLHVLTKEGTNIKSLMDLKGRRVSIGAPNSGTEEQADYVLKALGIDWNKDLKKEKLGASESVAALKDGKIDAMFWSGAVPTSSVIDLATTPGMKMVIIPIGGEVADKIMKANPGVFHRTKFEKGIYPGVEADVDAIAITAVMTAMESFSAETVYQTLKAVFANTKEISAVWKEATQLTPEMSIKQMTPVAVKYLHPGAV